MLDSTANNRRNSRLHKIKPHLFIVRGDYLPKVDTFNHSDNCEIITFSESSTPDEMINYIWVAKDLEKFFNYRQYKVNEFFKDKENSKAAISKYEFSESINPSLII